MPSGNADKRFVLKALSAGKFIKRVNCFSKRVIFFVENNNCRKLKPPGRQKAGRDYQ